MIEFGEKIRQLREKKGYTQQILADKLYVTRQAVSRWECGARYPDLMTAKKIAEVFDVSMDELMSGEEIKKNVDLEPVLKTSPIKYVETILYGIAVCAYLIMMGQRMVAFIWEEPTKGEMLTFGNVFIYMQTVDVIIPTLLLAAGLVFSLQNKMTPKKIGVIMGAYYFTGIMEMLVIYLVGKLLMDMNGTPAIESCLSLLVEAAIVITIIFYFMKGKNQLAGVLYILVGIEVIYFMVNWGIWIVRTDLWEGVIRSIYLISVLGVKSLLIYETHMLDKKRNKAINTN